MTQSTDVSPIPAPILALRTLFESELREVSFPDVNRDVLEEAATRVETAAREVAQLEESLSAARRALQEGQDTLLLKAQRALAYARIFAEENPELLTRLDGVTLPRAPRKIVRSEAITSAVPVAMSEEAAEPVRKRGRPARNRPAGMLFASDDSTPAEGDAAQA